MVNNNSAEKLNIVKYAIGVCWMARYMPSRSACSEIIKLTFRTRGGF